MIIFLFLMLFSIGLEIVINNNDYILKTRDSDHLKLRSALRKSEDFSVLCGVKRSAWGHSRIGKYTSGEHN